MHVAADAARSWTGIDQLVEIIKVMGTPTRGEIFSLNPQYLMQNIPQLGAIPLTKVRPNWTFLSENVLIWSHRATLIFLQVLPRASPEAIALLYCLLRYTPETRITAAEALMHPFFDEIKQSQELFLPNGNRIDLDLLFLLSEEGTDLRRFELDWTSLTSEVVVMGTELSIRPDLNARIVPPHFQHRLSEQIGCATLADFIPVAIRRLDIDAD